MLYSSVAILFLFMLKWVQSDYVQERNRITEIEKHQLFGGDIILTEKEKRAHEIFLSIKYKELEESFSNELAFLPAQNFLNVKNKIEISPIFSIIKLIPKGASLHTHLTASVSSDFLFKIIVETENVYGCIRNGRLKLQVFNETNNFCNWALIKDMRINNTWSDNWIKSQISLIDVDKGDKQNTFDSIEEAWNNFRPIFTTITDMIVYRPIFEDYLYESLRELYEDNVYYVEFRTSAMYLYELNGTTYDVEYFFEIFTTVADKFKLENPKFIGAKLIYSVARTHDLNKIRKAVTDYLKFQILYPNLIIGFDLIGYEQEGTSLFELHSLLNQVKNVSNFFFHAGETKWYGTETDDNLIDAILLQSKRIGHGYSLAKHPKLLEMVKEKDIAIEICPISNQVLKLIHDIRNHPAGILASQNYPLIVCNDDPGFWGATGLSYDWYVFFMGLSRKDSGLGFLKQLALNSFKYSALSSSEKVRAILNWHDDWDLFVDLLITNNSN